MCYLFALLFLHLSLISAHDLTRNEVLEYLRQFDYLPATQNVTENDFILAIRELQRIGGLHINGQLDNQTLQLVQRKRCGLADTGIVRMTHSDRPPPIAAKQNARLSYKIRNASKTTVREIELVRRIVYDSLSIWRDVSNLQFVESNEENVDIEFSFQTANHGDGLPFDLKIVGHVFDEENKTQIHLNDQLNWTFHSNKQELNLKQVVLHQVGHALGLHHSDHPQSIMYPFYRNIKNDTRLFHPYEVAQIQRLYGSKVEATTKANSLSAPPQLITAKPLSNLPIDVCNSEVDAVEIIENKIFMFRNEKYWQLSLNGTMITRPRLIREYWPELLTWPVDAALEMNGQVLMFVGNQVLTFQNRRLMSTKNLTELGLPSDLTKVRLAYKWFYGDVMHFVWNETHYWKLDARTMKTEVDYPRLISNIWKGIPTTVSAAFSWSNELWFVDAGVMFKFDSFKMDVSRGYPRRFSHILDHCLPRAEA